MCRDLKVEVKEKTSCRSIEEDLSLLEGNVKSMMYCNYTNPFTPAQIYVYTTGVGVLTDDVSNMTWSYVGGLKADNCWCDQCTY